MKIQDQIKSLEKEIQDVENAISIKRQELAALEISDLYTEQDFIDSCETEVIVLGETFNELELAKDITPITFRCAYNDWLDTIDIVDTEEAKELQSEIGELQDQLEDLQCELDDLNG